MSMLSDFLNENGFSADDVVARSAGLESIAAADRARADARHVAREKKKSYEELKLEKPGAYGRGISMRSLRAALAGDALPRIPRKKITRAVNSLLASGKKDPVETRQLFGDAPSRKPKKK